MSFENWERFLHDTIEELNKDSSKNERTNTERTRELQRRIHRREDTPGIAKATPQRVER